MAKQSTAYAYLFSNPLHTTAVARFLRIIFTNFYFYLLSCSISTDRIAIAGLDFYYNATMEDF